MVSNLRGRVTKILPLILSKLHQKQLKKGLLIHLGALQFTIYNLSTSKKQESSKEEVKM